MERNGPITDLPTGYHEGAYHPQWYWTLLWPTLTFLIFQKKKKEKSVLILRHSILCQYGHNDTSISATYPLSGRKRHGNFLIGRNLTPSAPIIPNFESSCALRLYGSTEGLRIVHYFLANLVSLSVSDFIGIMISLTSVVGYRHGKQAGWAGIGLLVTRPNGPLGQQESPMPAHLAHMGLPRW